MQLQRAKAAQCRNFIKARPYTSTCPPPINPYLFPRPPRFTSLAGTVPYHTSYLLIHAHDPPSQWPSTFTSRLYLECKKKFKEHHALVNYCWLGGEQPAQAQSEEAVYRATLWQKTASQEVCNRVDIPILSMKNVGKVVESIYQHPGSAVQCEEDMAASGPYFYICTHMNRDCRCGVRGGQLVSDLRKELDIRGMLLDHQGKPRVAEVGHVGGHKNAPNLLVFPHGDWYGNLDSKDLPQLIDHYVRSLEEIPISPSTLTGPNRFQWRGRIGMTEKEQSDAFRSLEWGATDLLGFSGLLL